MKKALIIMAKVPIAGKVKTRLQPFLTPTQSAELAKSFLQDAEIKAKEVVKDTIIAYTPFEKESALMEVLREKHILVLQKGKDIGEKMFYAFDYAFSEGFDAVLMIGTDSPDLPQTFFEEAFEILKEKDVVLGKTMDGGFYLIGLTKLDKEIFEGVRWSSEKTFEQTLENFERLNFSVGFLPIWYDVDTFDDLKKLKNELKEKNYLAPNTFEWLKRF